MSSLMFVRPVVSEELTHADIHAFYSIDNVLTYEIKEMLVQIERFKLFTHFQDGRHQITHFSLRSQGLMGCL